MARSQWGSAGGVLALAMSASLTAMAAPAPGPAAQVTALADEYVALILQADPTPAYYDTLPLERHDYLPRNSAADRARFDTSEDAIWRRFQAIDAPALHDDRNAELVYAQMREFLETSRALRVCKAWEWNVNHMFGWQNAFTELAARQPVSTPQLREQALARWGSLPAFIDTEIANLREGVQDGRTAPKPVVARVVKQVDALLAVAPRQSPLFAPAREAKDAAFSRQFEALITDKIQPALKRYRDFLANEYQPRARDTLGLSAMPDGEACYRAMLRQYTTLDRAPRDVFALGEKTVNANVVAVQEIGQSLFGTRDLKAIVKRVDEAPDNRFASADEQLAFSRQLLDTAREKSAPFFSTMPKQPAIVEPLKPEQRNTGVSSHYEPQPDESKPGVYRANLDHPDADRRGAAEITLVHETWPGHHLQIALARTLGQRHPMSVLTFNSAYVEGWARYSEALSEEAGIYTTPYARISRRLWPARGMVADPGIHVLGWTREQATAYMAESGRFSPEMAAELVDRIAAMPGQLTAYDSGGLEIVALRNQAQAALGKDFDVRQFHDQVLGDGVVPLRFLRERVEAWIAQRKAQSKAAR